MNIQFSGGTAQQQRWVKDAIAACVYPLDIFPTATVTFTWAATLPPSDIGKEHAYMVTTSQLGEAFLVTIASWADDPTNPNNQGLPNPSEDINDFYKASVIHELGHVVSHLTFEFADPNLPRVCALFWTANTSDGSARRYGSQSDWDAPALTWAQEIREAVAEMFKLAFYNGREVFGNRTQWNIDESSWETLVGLMPQPSPGGLVPVTFFDNAFSSGDYLVPSVVNGVSHISDIVFGGSIAAYSGQGYVYAAKMPLLATAWTSTIKVTELARRDDGFGLSPALGMGDLAGDNLNPPPSLFGAGGVPAGAGDAFPYWIRASLGGGPVVLTVWDTDPELGGSPIATSNFAIGTVPAKPVPLIFLEGAGSGGDPTITGQTVISEWRVHTFRNQPPRPPVKGSLPPPPEGSIIISPGLRGAVRYAG